MAAGHDVESTTVNALDAEDATVRVPVAPTAAADERRARSLASSPFGERLPDDLPALPEPGPPVEGSPFEARAAESASAWERQIEVYEREAATLESTPEAALIHLEIGRIHEEHLGRIRQAADAYQRAHSLDGREPTILHACRRLFAVAGQWNMVVEILENEIEATGTPERRATLLAELGGILEDKVRDPERALSAYERAVREWPAEPIAVSALERIYLFEHRYEDLHAVYGRALEVAKDLQRRLPLLLSAAQIAEDRLDATDAAIDHYREVLELDADSEIALAALRRLTHRAERWEDFADALARSATRSKDAEVRSHYLVGAARIRNERLDQPDRALRSLLEALEATPGDLSILREIESLYERNHRFEDVAKVLSRELDTTEDPRERVPILYKLGTVLEDQLGREDEALAAYRETVRLMATHVPARQALGRLYGRTARWGDLAELFEMEIRLEEDDAGKVSKLFKLAELHDAKLDDERKAIEVLRELLSIRPDYQPARKYLERLLHRREEWSEIIRLYREDVELTSDVEQKVFLLGRIGIIAEEKAGDLEAAQSAYRRILELVPRHLSAIRTLSRLATRLEDWVEVLRMHELEAEAVEDQQELVGILHRTGVVTEERLRDPEAAMAHYEKALKLNPTYLPALRSLGRIYGRQERWDDLVAMFERELEVIRAPEQQVALLFRIADVYVNQTKRDDQAVQALERVLEIDGESLPALRALAEIHERNRDGERLVETLLRESETLTEPKDRAAALMKVAELCEEKLDRPDRAAEIHEQILRLGFVQDPSIRALVRLYSARGSWSELSRALETAYEHARDDASRAAILLRCAEVASDRLHNLDGAADHLEKALALDADNPTLLSRLERVSLARRDWNRALSVAERLAERERDPRQYAARQIQIATIKETQLDPPQSGAENYRRALERVPDHPVALRAMELAYLSAQNWRGLATLFQREALVTESPIQRAHLFCRAAEIAEEHEGDLQLAEQMLDRALEKAPEFLPALRGRRRIAERMDDPRTVLRCIEAEVDLTAEPEHARDLLFEAGKIQQDRFEDVGAAVEAYEGVLGRAPGHEPAFRRLEAIYLEGHRFEDLLSLYERRSHAVASAEEQASLSFDAGKVAQNQLGDIERAIGYYRRVLEHEPSHEGAVERLGPIHFARQEWDEALDSFHRSLAVTKDPEAKITALKSLGIIYQEHRPDLVKAVQSFHAALQAEPRDVDCLRRLGAVYKEARDWPSAVNVFLRLTEATPDRSEKVGSLLQLGDLYEQGTRQLDQAILAYRKVLEIDATNQVAILRLLELYESKEDWQALAETTSSYVATLSPSERHKAAPLYLKLADVYESRLKDDDRAVRALQSALEAKPDEAKALQRLAALYAKSRDTYPQSIDAHRRLLRLQPFRTASYREMFTMYEELKEYDKAFVLAEILVFLRAANQDEEYYFELHKSKVAPRAEGRLPSRDHARWVVHPDERGPMREVLEVVAPELGRMVPGDLNGYELNPRTDKHGPKSDLPLRKLADELAEALGAPAFDLWVSQKAGVALALENDRVPALVVGSQFGRRLQDADQRFGLARELERLKGGHALVEQMSHRDVEALLWSVATLVNPRIQGSVDPAAADQMQRAVRQLSSKAKKQIEQIGDRLTRAPIDIGRHRAAMKHTANRAGLVFTNDVAVAVRNIAKRFPDVRPVFRDASGAEETVGQIDEVRELLAFAVSEEYFAARTRLAFSIQS